VGESAAQRRLGRAADDRGVTSLAPRRSRAGSRSGCRAVVGRLTDCAGRGDRRVSALTVVAHLAIRSRRSSIAHDPPLSSARGAHPRCWRCGGVHRVVRLPAALDAVSLTYSTGYYFDDDMLKPASSSASSGNRVTGLMALLDRCSVF